LAHFYIDRALDPGVRGAAAARAALALDPESSEAHETLGWAYHLGGQPGLALQPLERALELSEMGTGRARADRWSDGDRPERLGRIHYRLGEVYRALGQSERAYQHFEWAADLDWHGPIGVRARESMAQVKRSD
jgi:tetratricopeptide (TPR) repeat protein